jgi:hypothetical protein
MSAGKPLHDIRAVLLSSWDPIGIRDEPEAQDEYDDYVPAVLGLLSEGVEVDVIAEHLTRIETDRMCLPPNPERARGVATKLRELTT